MARIAIMRRKADQNRSPASVVIGLLLLGTIAGALLSACAASKSRLENSAPSANIEAGRQIANTQCSGCHIIGADGSVQRKDRIPGFPWIAHQEDLNVETLMLLLKSDHDRMPHFTLTEKQLRAISEYILSLNLPSRSRKSLQ